MSKAATLLEVQDLDVHIGATRVCRKLSFRLETGRNLCILGPNGAGKTTLLLTLAGLHPADAGQIRILQHPLAQYDRKTLATRLGLLLQNPESRFPGTVFEAALNGRHPHLGRLGWEHPQDLALAQQAIEQVGLSGLEQRQIQNLSGGERQRLEIATLLCQNPRLALLDEPSNHLDPGQQVVMLNLLQEQFSTGNRASIMVLHDIQLVQRFGHHLLMLKGDGEWRYGDCAELVSEAHLSWLYDHPVSRHHNTDTPCFRFL